MAASMRALQLAPFVGSLRGGRSRNWRESVRQESFCYGCAIGAKQNKSSTYKAASKGSRKQEKEQGSGKRLVQEDGGLPSVLPKPPAGFVVDGRGKVVLMAPAHNRVVTLVDPTTKRPLECVVRRAFLSSDGLQCLLLTPLDMALQILKIEEEREGLTDLTDQELDKVLPTASYALAKIRLHLVLSGYCLTARGGFCYAEEDVIDLNTEYGEGLGGSLAEGVEITNFYLDDVEYLVYTPFDPLMFVARKDNITGELSIADDQLLDDDAVLDAIDEENEFQAMVEDEEAVNRALRGRS